MPISTAEFLAMEARVSAGRKAVRLGFSEPVSIDRESALHNQIIAHCRANVWIYFHGSTAHKTKRTLGEPDFTLLLPNGRVLFIECKGKDTKISHEQLAMEAWMKQLSHKLHFVRSFEEFLQVIG